MEGQNKTSQSWKEVVRTNLEELVKYSSGPVTFDPKSLAELLEEMRAFYGIPESRITHEGISLEHVPGIWESLMKGYECFQQDPVQFFPLVLNGRFREGVLGNKSSRDLVLKVSASLFSYPEILASLARERGTPVLPFLEYLYHNLQDRYIRERQGEANQRLYLV